LLNDEEIEGESFGVPSRLIFFLLLGIIFVFLGITVLVIASLVLGSSGNVGGIILIGPIPIVFGAGSYSSLLIAISIILTVVSTVIFLVIHRHTRRINP